VISTVLFDLDGTLIETDELKPSPTPAPPNCALPR